MSPTRHTRTRSMPARTPVELVFRSDDLPSPAPTRLVKSRPFAHVRDSIDLRREHRARPPLYFVPGHEVTRCARASFACAFRC